MLKLENVNKYFNRHKKNEIHAINDTSLNFDSKGLVALLGPSGCGKTTLLNAIGGLDKINRGRIYINGQKVPNRLTIKKDKMRVLNIGYIFQDYNLLENLTVFENVALSLKMIGLKNREEIEKRVYYTLEKVGMYRYRNKLAGNLSGGEKQRVGIARAIVKNPSIIIADEPTGNLDSKNTLEVMNIIKSISKDKLVILVTHEKDLAHFYASRIVNIEDGRVISDNKNEHENELDYRIDNKIYLKDFKNHEKIEEKGHNLDFYYDDKEPIDLDIVVKNGNIYIKSNNFNKVEIVDENSSIEFIDDNYKKISKRDYEKYDFDLNTLDNTKFRMHYSSIYNIFSMIKSGIKKVFGYTIMKKMLLIGFFISAMFIVYAVSNIFGVTNIKESNFVTMNKEYITIENNKNDLKTFLELEKDENIDYVLPGNSIITGKPIINKIYQFQDIYFNFSFSLSSKEMITSDDLIHGVMPSGNYEVIIDKMTIDKALLDSQYGMVGLKTYEDFLGLEFLSGNKTYKIVGITDKGSPSLYVDKKHFQNMIANAEKDGFIKDGFTTENSFKNYEFYQNDITLKQGSCPTNDYEVIVNVDMKDMYPINKTIDIKVGENKLKVVGYYYSKSGDTSLYVSENTIKYDTIINSRDMTIYSKDKDGTLEYLQNRGFNAVDTYEKSRQEYINSAKESIMQSLIIAGILLSISFIEIFLMIRASFLSRIKEVGIYRAIGVKKTDIYKMFLGEILVITTLGGIPGYILMSLLLKEFTKIAYLKDLYLMDTKVLLISIVLIYGLNIIIGLLPIRSTIKKTPVEILSRNDID